MRINLGLLRLLGVLGLLRLPFPNDRNNPKNPNNPKLFNQGVSLPLTIGLVLLLMTASAAVSQLIIRTLRQGHQIEASTRAYGVAEAGIEDALYELSAHVAGYETPDLGDPAGRQMDFNPGRDIGWKNQWTIQSHNLAANCSAGMELCGEIRPNRKLALSFFNDKGEAIQTLDVASVQIQFRVPAALLKASDTNEAAFANGLIIDNDGDDEINEDGENDEGECIVGAGGRPVSNRDADCDGKENEDSAEDPVIYWKLLDNAGKTLVPKRGCLDENDPQLPGGSELCEKNFVRRGEDIIAALDQTAEGIREDGATEQSIADFLAQYSGLNDQQLQMEFLIVAPLEQRDEILERKIPIPMLEYDVDYVADEVMPAPYFVIQSDGYYKDFKQSITTTLTPKTSVPLGDFTLIQQQ